MRILLGTGALDWNRDERKSDRYGTVSLFLTMEHDVPLNLQPSYEWQGKRGCLLAIVRENHRSSHVGDRARGFFPPQEPLPLGTELTLGEGVLFIEQEDGMAVGLAPDDGRLKDWLDPNVLYQLHSQTVDLFFSPARSLIMKV